MVDDALKNEILAFEAVRDRAQIEADIDTLRPMLADDLIHVHSTGETHGKEQFLAHLARMGGFIAIERKTIDIARTGDVVRVSGRRVARMNRMDTGKEATLDGFATVILKKGPQGWQVWLSQLTPFRTPG